METRTGHHPNRCFTTHGVRWITATPNRCREWYSKLPPLWMNT